ncbi:hypothetical protein [Undibacterium terreum]|uniref:Uncharacterized protein n=1 Tax=Undibacterium terreum TaxID=1224302 RepID=A0A916XPL5_9BURK|nr:hypothetical protein [Undibacterium terreum]GGC88922.1 hypothetical protein GCM10011396_40180 [Undibacterium terreum]
MNSHPVYVESQFASMVWAVMPVASLAGFLLHYNLPNHDLRNSAISIIVAVNFVVLVLLGRLTISIDATHLRWHFGFLGWPAWKIALAEIESAEVAQSRWIEGWGIKYTKEGMLYNAAGTAAVRIHRRNGKSLRLGCKDPQRLLSYLLPRIPSSIDLSAVGKY